MPLHDWAGCRGEAGAHDGAVQEEEGGGDATRDPEGLQRQELEERGARDFKYIS